MHHESASSTIFSSYIDALILRIISVPWCIVIVQGITSVLNPSRATWLMEPALIQN